jgi:hypothetical protein
MIVYATNVPGSTGQDELLDSLKIEDISGLDDGVAQSETGGDEREVPKKRHAAERSAPATRSMECFHQAAIRQDKSSPSGSLARPHLKTACEGVVFPMNLLLIMAIITSKQREGEE